jgi:hypothetical protein
MPGNENLETLGEIWDSLSTGRKWGLFVFVLSVLIGSFWAGFGVAAKLYEARVATAENNRAAVEARMEREITDSRRQSPNKTQQASADSHQVASRQLLVFEEIEAIPQLVNGKSFQERNPPELPPKLPSVSSEEKKSTPDNRVTVVVAPQPANEIATFRFTVCNRGAERSAVSSADLLIEKVKDEPYNFQTTMYPGRIDHEGHIETLLKGPKVGDVVPIGIPSTIVEAGGKREFSIWFRSPDARKRGVVLHVTGRVRLHYEAGTCTSDPFEMKIHSEEHGDDDPL